MFVTVSGPGIYRYNTAGISRKKPASNSFPVRGKVMQELEAEGCPLIQPVLNLL
jgi:hypothetical protein